MLLLHGTEEWKVELILSQGFDDPLTQRHLFGPHVWDAIKTLLTHTAHAWSPSHARSCCPQLKRAQIHRIDRVENRVLWCKATERIAIGTTAGSETSEPTGGSPERRQRRLVHCFENQTGYDYID